MSHAQTYHLYKELSSKLSRDVLYPNSTFSESDADAITSALAPIFKVIGVSIVASEVYNGAALLTVKGKRLNDARIITYETTGIDICSTPAQKRGCRYFLFSDTVSLWD